jgi:hypothetical protein
MTSILYVCVDDRYFDIDEYVTDEFPSSNPIWIEWQRGYYTDISDNEQELPTDKFTFDFLNLKSPESAACLARHLDWLDPEGEEEVQTFIEWLRYWSYLGCCFTIRR